MQLITQTIQDVFNNIASSQKIYIAYSGGVDSHVLLHAAAQCAQDSPQLTLEVIHIHHGLLAEADDWAKHCMEVCEKLKLTCQVLKVKVNRDLGESLEAAARDARYSAFEKLLQPNDLLLTAHHQDDQAETCLLQFLRGSGIKGLSGMPCRMKFAKGFLVRPFLNISRQDILEYANHHQLHWVEDESNHDVRFTRNFIRYRMMPLLQERWPNISKTITRVSYHCSDANQLLQQFADQDLKQLRHLETNTLSLDKLKNLSLAQQKNVVREWLYQQDILLPSTEKLKNIIQEVIQAKSDAAPCVSWSNVEIRRYANELYAMPALSCFDTTQEFLWNGESPLTLPADMGSLTAKEALGRGLCLSKLKKPFKIVFRQGGEHCYLPGHQHSRTLKNLFQEWHVPTWLRSRIPLIYVDDQLAMIVGYAVCDPFVARGDEMGLEICWNKKKAL